MSRFFFDVIVEKLKNVQKCSFAIFLTQNFLGQRPTPFENSIFDNFSVCRAVFQFHIRKTTTGIAIRILIFVFYHKSSNLNSSLEIFRIVDDVHKNKTKNYKSP